MTFRIDAEAVKKMHIPEIRETIKSLPFSEYEHFIGLLHDDGRQGAVEMALSMNRALVKHNRENLRMEKIHMAENALREDGYGVIAGMDEAGRGPLCGPVVSAAVILPENSDIRGVNDSKKLTPRKREELYEKITDEAIAYSVGIVDNKTIDRINILNATKLSMKEAVEKLNTVPDILLIDALTIDVPVKQRSYIKGDENLYSIAAASIIAKVTRDRLMNEYDKLYPKYGFAENKGYGTEEHMAAIIKYGLTPIHRKSFISDELKSPSRITGAKYEEVACKYLVNNGYKIIERNFKRGDGEIDIIAFGENTLVFCEVKARNAENYVHASDTLTYNKRDRIKNTAQCFLSERKYTGKARFDFIAIEAENGKAHIYFYKNVFDAD